MKSGSVWLVSLWVSGASLGAGLLALPIQSGLAGLVPALSGLVFIWALMLGTGLILADFFVDMAQPSAQVSIMIAGKYDGHFFMGR